MMKRILLFGITLMVVLVSCSAGEDNVVFDHEKWLIKEGKDYPYREQMVEDVLHNDTIRSLSKATLIRILGEPTRENEGHMYYRIDQTRLLGWPLHTTTLVIKMENEQKVEWIRLHK